MTSQQTRPDAPAAANKEADKNGEQISAAAVCLSYLSDRGKQVTSSHPQKSIFITAPLV